MGMGDYPRMVIKTTLGLLGVTRGLLWVINGPIQATCEILFGMGISRGS